MRVILVPLDGGAHDRPALAGAFAAAKLFAGHVDGLFMRPDPLEQVANFGPAPSESVVRTLRRAASRTWDERAAAARSSFEVASGGAGAMVAAASTDADQVTARWREITGRGDTTVAQYGRLADLIVFAGLGRGDDERRQRMVMAALLHAARPLLLVPDQGADKVGSVVAIAWNGSAEATRAVAGALPFLHQALRVHVLTAGHPRSQAESGEALGDYLGRRGVSNETHPMFPSGDVGAALLAKASELGADLVVMGGYGHSRMQELIFGGVTRHVLHHYELPILLAH